MDDPANRNHYVALLRGIATFGDDYPEARKAAELLKRAQLNQPDMPLKLLVKMGEMAEDENILLERYGIPSRWTDEALKESERIHQSVTGTVPPMHRGRMDLQDLTIPSLIRSASLSPSSLPPRPNASRTLSIQFLRSTAVGRVDSSLE